MPSRPAVVLIGPPAAGKSRIGRKTAKYLDLDFLDTDSVIVAEHGPIADIFLTRGEAAFRAIEREVVERALGTGGVVSLGGGAVLDEQTRDALRAHRVVLLTVSAEAVERRISGRLAKDQRRPLLAADTTGDRLAAWQKLVDSRRSVYESLATSTWDTSERPITAIAREIADWAEKDMTGAIDR
ncbi:MAG TPA: shikimate kinase [Homoserinimonas sp.]|nr:shikimate kinase [Homoserinimonas sp.]